MRNIHLKYVTEAYDENGLLTDFQVNCPEDFNFGYDVVDGIALAEPERPCHGTGATLKAKSTSSPSAT